MSPSRPIIDPGRNAWRQALASDSGVLIDAADYYRAFYESARAAQHYLLMSGWQFDSGVALLRGDDAPAGRGGAFPPVPERALRREPRSCTSTSSPGTSTSCSRSSGNGCSACTSIG